MVIVPRPMVSWLSLCNRPWISASLRCLTDMKGFASNESKFASPAPGTISVEIPWLWPTPRMSSSGRNRTLLTRIWDNSALVRATKDPPPDMAVLGGDSECFK